MAKIKPTFTLVSNANSATTDPGPLSFALNLSAKPANNVLLVDTVESEIWDIDSSHAGGANATVILHGSDYTSGDPITSGGYVYLKNISTDTADRYIAIGIETEDATAAVITGTSSEKRLMTLEPGEFAWFPWDYNQDITADASHDNQKLEVWVFDRSAT